MQCSRGLPPRSGASSLLQSGAAAASRRAAAPHPCCGAAQPHPLAAQRRLIPVSERRSRGLSPRSGASALLQSGAAAASRRAAAPQAGNAGVLLPGSERRSRIFTPAPRPFAPAASDSPLPVVAFPCRVRSERAPDAAASCCSTCPRLRVRGRDREGCA